MLIELLYASDAAQETTPQALVALLETSRRNNTRTGVTGMLLFHQGCFMQLLEGEEEAVMRLYQRILEDPRHTGSRVLWKGPVAARSFADWSMAFRTLDEIDPARLEGFSRLLEEGFSGPFLSENPTVAQSLMRTLSDLED